MVLEVVMFLGVFVILAISSFTDIRTREVPDLLSWGLFVFALSLRALFSFVYGYELFLSGLIGAALCFALAFVLYYTGQWGGADSKLLVGMGAVLGVDFLFGPLASPLAVGTGFDLLAFIVLLLFSGAFYSLLWTIGLALLNQEKFIHEFRLLFYDSQGYFKTTLVIFVLGIFLGLSQQWIFAAVGSVLFLSYGTFLGVIAVERGCFVKQREVSKLVEGDWLVEKVRGEYGSTIYPKTLEKVDLLKLHKWYEKEKIKFVMIKEGVPFVPAFLCAYTLLLLQEWWLPLVQSFL